MTASDTILDLAGTTDEAVVRSPGWYRRLAGAVNDLADRDFAALVQLLYRFDVDENRIRRALAEMPGSDAGTLIAGLLLERQLQKIAMRRHFATVTPKPEDREW